MLKEGLKEGLYQQESTASRGTLKITRPIVGGTSTTLVLLRRTPTSTIVIGLLVNNGTADDQTTRQTVS